MHAPPSLVPRRVRVRWLRLVAGASRGGEGAAPVGWAWAERLEVGVALALCHVGQPEEQARRYVARMHMLLWHMGRLWQDARLRDNPDLCARLPDSWLSRDLPWVRARAAEKRALEVQREAAAKKAKADVHFGAYGHCKRCGTRLDVQHIQTRSADEGSTVYLSCSKCDKRWKL